MSTAWPSAPDLDPALKESGNLDVHNTSRLTVNWQLIVSSAARVKGDVRN